MGYSARFGGWSSGEGRAGLQRFARSLAVLLMVAPLPGYVGYRVIRGVRGRPAPALQGGLGILVAVIVVIGFMTAITPALTVNVAARGRAARARTELRGISAAIAQYRAHMGSSPAALGDLTVAVANSQGQIAGPFLAAVPAPPFGGSRLQYAYKRSPDGRYFLKYSDPSGRSPTVLERGS